MSHNIVLAHVAALFARNTPEADRLACAYVADLSDDAYAAVIARYPALRDYDERGNYVGSVANENGWTA